MGYPGGLTSSHMQTVRNVTPGLPHQDGAFSPSRDTASLAACLLRKYGGSKRCWPQASPHEVLSISALLAHSRNPAALPCGKAQARLRMGTASWAGFACGQLTAVHAATRSRDGLQQGAMNKSKQLGVRPGRLASKYRAELEFAPDGRLPLGTREG